MARAHARHDVATVSEAHNQIHAALIVARYFPTQPHNTDTTRHDSHIPSCLRRTDAVRRVQLSRLQRPQTRGELACRNANSFSARCVRRHPDRHLVRTTPAPRQHRAAECSHALRLVPCVRGRARCLRAHRIGSISGSDLVPDRRRYGSADVRHRHRRGANSPGDRRVDEAASHRREFALALRSRRWES